MCYYCELLSFEFAWTDRVFSLLLLFKYFSLINLLIFYLWLIFPYLYRKCRHTLDLLKCQLWILLHCKNNLWRPIRVFYVPNFALTENPSGRSYRGCQVWGWRGRLWLRSPRTWAWRPSSRQRRVGVPGRQGTSIAPEACDRRRPTVSVHSATWTGGCPWSLAADWMESRVNSDWPTTNPTGPIEAIH